MTVTLSRKPVPVLLPLAGGLHFLAIYVARFGGVELSEDEELRLAAVAAAVRWICKDVEASVGQNKNTTRCGTLSKTNPARGL